MLARQRPNRRFRRTGLIRHLCVKDAFERGTKTMNLTPRQLDVIVAIRNFRHLHGYSPTMQELADQLGTSKVTIFEHVNALERKRVLRRDRHKARSLEIITDDKLPDEERTTKLPDRKSTRLNSSH